MSHSARDFLLGFERAAVLTQRMLAHPPDMMSAPDYMGYVADLYASADDPLGRGLAVGCLSALGRG